MSSAYATPEAHMLDFSLSKEDSIRIKTALQAIPANEERFTVEAQLTCYNLLSDEEKLSFKIFWQALEAGDDEMSWSIISKLYTLPPMKDESRGALALLCRQACTTDTPLESILLNATPLSRVRVDDWAYYTAIAALKLDVSQPLQALEWLELAELVRHRHTRIVSHLRTRAYETIHYNDAKAKRVIPRLLTSSETIISTFKDADTFREVIPDLLRQVKEKPSILPTLREENRFLQRLVSRADHRYYFNNWQILPNPEPQPNSSWARLPEAVIRAMACVVDWRLYLNLASTCKLLHNRLNQPTVWLSVLENKWNLDVTAFDESIPKNPVQIVQRIHAMTKLRLEDWREVPAHTFPSNMLDLVIAKRFDATNLRDPAVAATEVYLSLFGTVIAADRTGDLTAYLLENCTIFDHILNAIKTNTDGEHDVPGIAIGCLTSLYLRSRRTCALVSRYLPPPLAWTFALTKNTVDEETSIYFGLAAAAMTSYVLYPGAHDLATPTLVDGSLVLVEETDRFEKREGDFQPVILDPQHSANDLLLESSTDLWGKNGDPDELPMDLVYFNMNKISFGENPAAIGEALATAAMLDEPDQGEDPPVDEDLLANHRMMVLWRKHSQHENEDFEEAHDQEEADAKERGEHIVDSVVEYGVAEDPFGAESLKRDSKKALERFTTANGEWRLFLTFHEENPAMSVIHQGIINMTLDEIDETASEDDMGVTDISESSGFWTIDSRESMEDVKSGARQRNGNYGFDENAKSAEQLITRERWEKNHAFSFENGTVDLRYGFIRAEVLRGGSKSESGASRTNAKKTGGKKAKRTKAEKWILRGDSFPFGYQGRLYYDAGDGAGPAGSFLLMKSEDTGYANDLSAFDRLAHLRLQYGPLAKVNIDPEWTPELGLTEEELSDCTFQLTAVAAILHGIGSNNQVTARIEDDVLLGSEQKETLFSVILFPDAIYEEPRGPLYKFRRAYAFQLLRDTNFLRSEIFRMSQPLEDISIIRPFMVAPTIENLHACFSPYARETHVSLPKQFPLSAMEWEKVTTIYFKWVARLRIFELAGVPVHRGIGILISMFQSLIYTEEDGFETDSDSE